MKYHMSLQELTQEIHIQIIKHLTLHAFTQLLSTSKYWNTFLDSDFQEIYSGMYDWLKNQRIFFLLNWSRLGVSDIFTYLFSTDRIDLAISFMGWFDIEFGYDENYAMRSAIQTDRIENVKFLEPIMDVDLSEVICYDAIDVFKWHMPNHDITKWLDSDVREYDFMHTSIITDICLNHSFKIMSFIFDQNILIPRWYEICTNIIHLNHPDFLNLFLSDSKYNFLQRNVADNNSEINSMIIYAISQKSLKCAIALVQSSWFDKCDKQDALRHAVSEGDTTLFDMINTKLKPIKTNI